MLPGYGEKPVAGSAASPAGETVARSSGSSWLYSTLTVIARPGSSVDSRRTTAPISWPGARGTHIELASSASAVLTPTNGARLGTIAGAFVSWKKKTCDRPSPSQRAASPELCSSACTSPWPCGFACSRYASSGSSASRASLSASAGTFCCLISVSCPGASSPKLPFALSSAAVASCVSSEVMIASGRKPRGGDVRACRLRIWRAYSSK